MFYLLATILYVAAALSIVASNFARNDETGGKLIAACFALYAIASVLLIIGIAMEAP